MARYPKRRWMSPKWVLYILPAACSCWEEAQRLMVLANSLLHQHLNLLVSWHWISTYVPVVSCSARPEPFMRTFQWRKQGCKLPVPIHCRAMRKPSASLSRQPTLA